MISAIEKSPTFSGKAIVKVNGAKPLEDFKRKLAIVAKNMGKETKFSRLINEHISIPQDILVVSGTKKVTKKGTTLGIIVEDNGDDATLIAALKKVFGDNKVLSWNKLSINK